MILEGIEEVMHLLLAALDRYRLLPVLLFFSVLVITVAIAILLGISIVIGVDAIRALWRRWRAERRAAADRTARPPN